MADSSDVPNFYQAVYAWVREVPRGRVVTYGQVATYLGSPRAARAVGYALAHLDDGSVPWHRVVNADGRISVGGRVDRPGEQLRRLRREGVRFDADERICLKRYRYLPRRASSQTLAVPRRRPR